MKKILIILSCLFCSSWAFAQQQEHYSMYMMNYYLVNPAEGGTDDYVDLKLGYRTQWVGLEGAPKTGTLAIHSPVGKRVGLGVSLINDEIGPVRETNAYADFSYTLPMGADNKLAFGVKAGATFHKIGISEVDIDVIDAGDPFFAENIDAVTPNVGAGVYFYKPNKYYVSVSVPNILNATHLDASGTKIGSETQHLFAAVGYVFDLSENFKLKPHALLKTAFTAPLSFDVNANLFMYDFVELGVGYRLEDSFSGMVNFKVAPNLRVGYAYDSIQSDLNYATSSSHEVFINFDISFPKRVSRSPRYF